MRMLALLISFTIAYPTALADDTPLVTAEGTALATLDVDPVLYIQPITKGQPSPVDGRVMDYSTYIAIAQRTARAEAERDALRTSTVPPGRAETAILCVLGVLGGVAVGWALGARLAPK